MIIHKNLSDTWPNSGFLIAYYWKHVISNLKIILKGKALGFSEEEINKRINLTAEEKINRRDLVAGAISAQSLEEAIKVLKKSEFGNMIEDASNIYRCQEPDFIDGFTYVPSFKELVNNVSYGNFGT